MCHHLGSYLCGVFLGSTLVWCLFTTFTHPRAPAAVNYRLHSPPPSTFQSYTKTLLLPVRRYREYRHLCNSLLLWYVLFSLFPFFFSSNSEQTLPLVFEGIHGVSVGNALRAKVHFNSPITRRFNPAVKERASCAA